MCRIHVQDNAPQFWIVMMVMYWCWQTEHCDWVLHRLLVTHEGGSCSTWALPTHFLLLPPLPAPFTCHGPCPASSPTQ